MGNPRCRGNAQITDVFATPKTNAHPRENRIRCLAANLSRLHAGVGEEHQVIREAGFVRGLVIGSGQAISGVRRLVLPQRHHGVDLGGAAGGHEAGGQ
jgi:hypothetical protein